MYNSLHKKTKGNLNDANKRLYGLNIILHSAKRLESDQYIVEVMYGQ